MSHLAASPAPAAAKVETELLETALAIGMRLCRDALWDGRRCNWQGASMEPWEGRWQVVQRTFGPELYAGTSGIALFLARLHRLTGESLLLATARAAMRQALSRADDVPPELRLGFYSGQMGIAWSCRALGDALGEDEWRDASGELAGRLAAIGPEGQQTDLLSGIAGAIPALLELARWQPGDALPEQALRLGDALIARARRHEHGWSWPSFGPTDLTGFSHGAAGISWALLELAAATGEAVYREAALQGFDYERHLFDAAQEGWPDLREMPAAGAPVYPVLWCHGAAGIGLSRLRAFELSGDAQLRAEAGAALRSTWRHFAVTPPEAFNFSLCHGAAGNAELFLEAARVLGQEEFRQAALRVGWLGMELYERRRRPWPGGVNGGGASPGLMLGEAGTGYFYLRLAAPEATPPVLIPIPGHGSPR